MKFRRILVVVKVIPRQQDLQRSRQARLAHERALCRVLTLLRQKGTPFHVVRQVKRRLLSGYDLVISVGGDGTFLEAARGVRKQRILGVNSDPVRSAGSFCAATAATFGRILTRILCGREKTIRLNRLQIVRNHRPMDLHLLNDLLITHRRPAAMSCYRLQVGRRREEQRSSGLWIATAAGSTGAIRSAGGRILTRTVRDLQYRPRELYAAGRKNYRLTGGVVRAGAPVRVVSLMGDGMICVDGEHVTLPFGTGDLLEVRASAYPLCLVTG